MKLPGRKTDKASQDAAGRPTDGGSDTVTAERDAGADQAGAAATRLTAPKGRPTPKRTDAARRRGPVAPAPMTSADARKRRKQLGGPKLSRAERRADKAVRRTEMSERRAKMMAGDEAYLLPRDRGQVRRFTRDVVDSRRHLLGLFMPAALALVFVMLAVPSLTVQRLLSPAMLALVVVMVIDGALVGRRVNKLVDATFPGNTESGWKLGFYAAGRASQIRRMRAPRPQVERGAPVT